MPVPVRTVFSSKPPEASFRVTVGVPPLPSHQPSQTPWLLIDADPERLHRAKEWLGRGTPGASALCLHGVVGQPERGAMEWFHFTDQRLNGPRNEAFWLRHFANARCIGRSIHSPVSMEELLEAWGEPAATHMTHRGLLTIRQGDPISVLESCGVWLQNFGLIQVRLPASAAEERTEWDNWLQRRGYLRDGEQQLNWKRDPVATASFLLGEYQHRCNELEDMLAAANVKQLISEETIDATKKWAQRLEQLNSSLTAENNALKELLYNHQTSSN